MLYQIHMLKNYPPTCLNRDETGMPKTCYFGGAQRGRISSQCLKHTWRTSPLFGELLGEKAVRTRKLPELVAERLKEKGFPDDVIKVLEKKATAVANKESKENNYLITPQIIFFSPEDVDAVADVMGKCADENKLDIKKIEKIKAKDILGNMKDVDLRPMTIDIALFGRMVTSDTFADVEASVQTAHALSTHAVNQESDYFTAVDDLVSGTDDEGDKGAAHINDTDYNSCCYYHYVAIDSDQLEKNLEYSPDARKFADKVLPAFIKIMAYTNPSGKQNSFAGQVLPDLFCVEIKEKKIPVSYVNAYAKPVRFAPSTDLIKESVTRLSGEIDMIDSSYGLEVKKRIWFSPRVKGEGSSPEKCEIAASLDELLRKCRD
ncbi:type I-E CRISPR-associated protein Cas7/Cse4/CasC [Synergistes jonesii]|uniref:type I-E CRISPR-associated protein Cas7/Cse4/CasC n=1 Tax=Synergistes jonesii TaxID=2754 RepID=UPI00248E1AFD|nr:type I-E CRISPR-associated protein Cas7/Cse4/CasC [Synergistes jonesii]